MVQEVVDCLQKLQLTKEEEEDIVLTNATKAVFGCRKIFSGNAIFRKGKYFQVFGCIMKIVVENIFMCLVLF